MMKQASSTILHYDKIVLIIVKMNILAGKEIIFKDAFPQMKTVYGGLQGVKLYLKQKVIETVYAWEDSGAEIKKRNQINCTSRKLNKI